MATSVWSALGVDKEKWIGKLIAVEECHGSNGNFVLNCLIAEQIHKDGTVCLVALRNSFGHYHNVGTKLGYNLHQLQEKGSVESIEVLKLLSGSLNSALEDGTQNFFFGDKETTVRNLFYLIEEKIKKLLQHRKPVSLVIDDLSDLLSLGIPVKEVLSFLQYCRSLLESQPDLSLVVLTHVAEGDEEQHLLSTGLCHVADITVTVSGLKTGQSSDVSGAMKVIHRRWNQPIIDDEWNKQNLYHFKLLDRQVAVRIRPLRANETQRVLHTIGDKLVVLEDEGVKNDVLRQKRGGQRQYVYDVVFGEDATQDMVYEATSRSLVSGVLMGYNATVFAYGPTGSGKTHTMVGNTQQPGIMVRALKDLFQAVQESKHPEQYAVTMSYLEIYNENIRDLLNPSSGFLELREDSRGRNIQVTRLSEISTTSAEEVMNLLQKGNRARTVEPTAANKTSSRSHALLSVTVQQTSTLHTHDKIKSRIKQGKLFMIDLAGSERASQTKNRGKRLQEGAHINRSLLALGNCINALSGGAHYVNYRDSKLTRLLKDALSGNCRTVMIAHVSPAAVHKDESRNTLLYADRAKNILNKVERNVLDVSYHVSQYRTIISELREEIARLTAKMKEDRPRSGDTSNDKAEKLKLLRDKIVSTFREQMRLRRRLMEYDSHLLSLSAQAERQHAMISQWESQNNKLYKNNTTARWQNHRPNTDSDFEVDRESVYTEGDAALQMAWSELAVIEKEQEHYTELRASIEQELESCRKQGAALENELPSQISSEEERELLALMCRVHELEIEKMALQSERLIKQHELWRRDLIILRYDRQRHLCEEIITRQRQLMEEDCVIMPPDLKELYRIYQQEIHASTYRDASPSYQSGVAFSSYARGKEKLPPILPSAEPLFQRSVRYNADNNSDHPESDISMTTPNSSAGSDYTPSPLPPVPGNSETGQSGQLSSLPPPAVLFPPIIGSSKELHGSSKYLSRYV